MLPVPEIPKPTFAVDVQLNEEPATSPLKASPGAAAPLQYVESPCAATSGVGLTVIKNVSGVPVQPLADGVTTTVVTSVVDPVLVAVYDPMLPVPAKPKPTLAVDVQLNEVPTTSPVKASPGAEVPLQ